MNCFLKGFIAKKLNKLLDGGEDGVQKARENVLLWTGRTEAVCGALKNLAAKLDDNKLTEAELEEAVAEVKALIDGWK
jgi:hypothetical protein